MNCPLCIVIGVVVIGGVVIGVVVVCGQSSYPQV